MATDKTMPAQEQSHQPGSQREMQPEPKTTAEWYKGSGKLHGMRVLLTGGDSGIGRSIATLFAREGAHVAFSYLDEYEDARETERIIADEGVRGFSMAGDIGSVEHCETLVRRTVECFGGLDVLINNAAEQHVADELEGIEPQQLERTFRTNIFAAFHVTTAALPHLRESGRRASIINTASVVAFKGKPVLVDYAATKGAMVAFTRSLAGQLAEDGIRVNAVAPGPIWTPLIPSSFDADAVAHFGGDTLMRRPGQPEEVAPAYVYLASRDSSFVTGQVLHVNGGEIVA